MCVCERESVCVCERESVCVCVCVCVRETVCVGQLLMNDCVWRKRGSVRPMQFRVSLGPQEIFHCWFFQSR